MKRTQLSIFATTAALALSACAAQQAAPPPAPMPTAIEAAPVVLASAAPATQPAPAPQSDIMSMLKQRSQPQQSVSSNDLPAGHPPVPGASNDMPELPAGHPTMEQMQAAAKKPASTQPARFGTLSVRAVQGTEGGPKIAGDLPVTVELYQDDAVIDKYEAKLAADGTATFNNIPVSLNVTPLVRVNYNGVDYSVAGEQMTGYDADQVVQVPVFETTEEAPAWNVQMQHVILEPSADGLRVMEMLAVVNPSDRSWTGKLGADNKRTTQTFQIPADAKDVQLAGGFHDCCTTIAGGQIINSMPLVPGTTQYRILYTLPVTSGNAQLKLVTPAPVDHFMVMAPDDGSRITAEGGVEEGTANMGKGKTRFFRANKLEANKQITLTLSGITAPTTATGASNASKASSSTAKIVAGAGGLVIFLVGGMFLLRKAPSGAKAH